MVMFNFIFYFYCCSPNPPRATQVVETHSMWPILEGLSKEEEEFTGGNNCKSFKLLPLDIKDEILKMG